MLKLKDYNLVRCFQLLLSSVSYIEHFIIFNLLMIYQSSRQLYLRHEQIIQFFVSFLFFFKEILPTKMSEYVLKYFLITFKLQNLPIFTSCLKILISFHDFFLYFSLLTCSFYKKKDHVESIHKNKSAIDLGEKNNRKKIYFVMAIQFIIYS